MLMNTAEYLSIIENIKSEITAAQYRVAVHVNADMLLLYYDIGCVINEHKSWGNKFIDNLAADIRIAFPESKGYSVRNLKYMAKFAEIYPDREFVQQVVAQIPWGHNIVLLDKVTDMDERKWYIKKSAENGWSRNVLVHQIESNLYQRQVLADKVTNFEHRLPSPQSELAVQTMKDPYVFDFIPFREDMLERDIEQALVRDVTKLLLELGTGFAFLGNQYHLNVGGDDFYIDLLFYNLNLRCYVVIELKTGDFKPEYAGQLNFYLSAVDGILKKEQDNPSIGLLLCKSKNNVVAEYSLKDIYGIHDKFLYLENKIFRNMDHIKQLRIYPPENGKCDLIVIYEMEEPEQLSQNGHYLSIDPGLHNLMTCYDSGNGRAFILGRKYLSLERYFHKEIARVQSVWYAQQSERGIKYPKTSEHIQRLYRTKQNAVKDYLHKVTRWIAEYCRKEDIRCVVVGDIRNIRKEKDMGHKTNQKLHSLPYNRLYTMLEYKLKRYGIQLIKQEESYTSQCSPLSPEVSKRYAEASNRKERGMYVTDGVRYNADAVGAFNILRKYLSVSGKQKELSLTGLKKPDIIKVAA